MARSPSEILEHLRKGNERFRRGEPVDVAACGPDVRARLASGQKPLAAVLACADSRVAPEVIFDQRLGELFTVRVAGNLPGPLEIASLAFAVRELGAGLVVVCGHTGCGAVAAALEEARRGKADPMPAYLEPLLERVRPIVRGILPAGAESAEPPAHAVDSLMEEAVRRNVEDAIDRLRAVPELAPPTAGSESAVVGALYHLETGAVEFLTAGP